MSWILVMYIYAGAMAKNDSVTMFAVEGFSTKRACQIAGNSGNELIKNTFKEYRYVCMEKK